MYDPAKSVARDNTAAAPSPDAEGSPENTPASIAANTTANYASDEGELVYLALSALEFDSDNVRKRGGGNVDELKALIASQGLLQNLIVSPHLTKRGKDTGKFGVIAGGRRLRALRALAAEGKIAKDEQVLCRIVSRERATITSASENSGREPMVGADTISAFAAMVREGKGVEDLAVAFGISAVTVQRRLKLANASPKLFDLYAGGQMALDQLMALCVIDDHARQEAIWEGAPEYQRHAAQLRRMALGEAVNAGTDRMALFVGLDAYIAAGGQITRDLFAEDDQGYCNDPALLAKLAEEKLGTERERLLSEGLPWVEVVDEFDHRARQDYVQAPTSQRKATKAEQKALKEAQKALAIAEKAMSDYENAEEEEEDDEGSRYATLDQAIDDARAQVEELLGNLRVVADDVRPLCGVVLAIERDGTLGVYGALVRKADAKKATSAAKRGEGSGEAGTGAEAQDQGQEESGSGLSDALQRRLSAQKTIAVQVELARHQQVAMAVLANTLMSELDFSGDGYLGSNITARNRDHELKLADPSIESSKAWEQLATMVATVKAQLPEDEDGLLTWLIEQQLDVLVQILALCTAVTVYNGTTTLRRGAGNVIADAVGLDMADYWSATGETYFKSVPKALIAEALAEVDPEAAKTVDKLKKGEAVALAEAKMKDTRWLPGSLRRG